MHVIRIIPVRYLKYTTLFIYEFVAAGKSVQASDFVLFCKTAVATAADLLECLRASSSLSEQENVRSSGRLPASTDDFALDFTESLHAEKTRFMDHGAAADIDINGLRIAAVTVAGTARYCGTGRVVGGSIARRRSRQHRPCAVVATLQRSLAQYADHAGIATQMVVERQLLATGQSRQAMGREAFVEKIWNVQ